MTTLNLTSDVEFKAASEDKPATFSIHAYTGQAVAADGWPLPLVLDLAGLEIPDRDIPVLRGHNHDRIVGHGRAVKTETDVMLTGVVSVENEHSREVIGASKNGFPWQASVGTTVLSQERLGKGKSTRVNGRIVTGPAIIGRRSRLNEVSFVPLGADRDTTAKVAAAAAQQKAKPMSAKLEKWAEEHNADLSAMDDGAKAAILELIEARESKKTESDKRAAGSSAELFASAKAERDRREAVLKLGRDFAASHPYHVEAIQPIVESAESDSSVQPRDVELELMRAVRTVGAVNRLGDRSSAQLSGQVYEAAVLQSLGFDTSDFSDEVNEAAHREFKGRIALGQLLIRAAKANSGQQFDTTKNPTPVVEAAFSRPTHFGRPANLFSGFSTLDIGDILANVQNKMLADYFTAFETSWREIAYVRQVSDLKPTSTVAMTSDVVYQQVGKGGEITHGTLGNQSYSNQAKTFAIMLGITDDDIINDDLGALAQVGRHQARGAALAINRDFWAEFLDDASFFTAGNGNLITDALASAGLASAKTALERQTDPNGNPMGLKGSIVLVPTELDPTLMALLNSQLVVGSTDRPDSNIWRGRYRPVVSQYLTDANDWYLLANPQVAPTIEVVFFGGQTPQVDTARASVESGRLGIVSRGVYRYGVAKQEYRAAVKSEVT